MSIKDRDVRDALGTLETEFENLESIIKDNEELIADLEKKNEKLQVEIDNLQDNILELEEALAEAYLTQQAGDAIQREDVILSPGQRVDVLNSTDDQSTN